LFGLSSLAAIAEDYIDAAKRHQETEDSMAVAVRMDAKRGEWFGGIYEEAENGVAATIGDRLWTDDEWQVASEGIITVEAGDWETHPPVAALLKLAAKRYGSGQRPQWSTILPFYGRKPPIHNG
ncbi:MAG: tRNA (adenosine(37)-N6)-threonylcarbamoyltransferase complex dimerization subunit type 1 TsaB, partial [Cyanobacteria bacterium P01_E01_bin.34]